MTSKISFFLDNEENKAAGKWPLSTNIQEMKWHGASAEWNLSVKFFNSEKEYEYKVNEAPCPFNDALPGETYADYFKRNGGCASSIWLEMVKGARWKKEQMINGETPERRSTGSAFHFLVKKPIGFNKKLYRVAP